MSAALCLGDQVRLLSKPDGCQSAEYPLTVGNIYQVLDFRGSNVVTTTDNPGETANYWRGRVERVGPAAVDACENCHGTRGGTPGNENIVDGRVLCDDCSADLRRANRSKQQ